MSKIRLQTQSEIIGILFIIGSSCFLVAGLQVAFPSGGLVVLRSAFAQNITFFIGSIFFTSAALLQFLQCIQHDLRLSHLSGKQNKWIDWRPRDCGYMASFLQFIGTILFNFNTGDPLWVSGGWERQDLAVWTPNAVGSALFLVSSVYGCVEVGHKFWTFEPRSFSWWVAWSNLAGSLLFGVSALLSFVPRSGTPPLFEFLASLMTAGGAFGFLLAAVLMLPEQADEPSFPAAH